MSVCCYFQQEIPSSYIGLIFPWTVHPSSTCGRCFIRETSIFLDPRSVERRWQKNKLKALYTSITFVENWIVHDWWPKLETKSKQKNRNSWKFAMDPPTVPLPHFESKKKTKNMEKHLAHPVPLKNQPSASGQKPSNCSNRHGLNGQTVGNGSKNH